MGTKMLKSILVSRVKITVPNVSFHRTGLQEHCSVLETMFHTFVRIRHKTKLGKKNAALPIWWWMNFFFVVARFDAAFDMNNVTHLCLKLSMVTKHFRSLVRNFFSFFKKNDCSIHYRCKFPQNSLNTGHTCYLRNLNIIRKVFLQK